MKYIYFINNNIFVFFIYFSLGQKNKYSHLDKSGVNRNLEKNPENENENHKEDFEGIEY